MPSAKRFPRLDQLLSSLGYASRREAISLIRDERVTVEGVGKLKCDLRVDPTHVRFDGEPLQDVEGLLIALHKPIGYVCSHAEIDGASVYELLPERWSNRSPQLVSIGRLDKDTTGLLLLTDQHELVHKLTSPKAQVEKVYEATLEREIDPKAVEIFASGTLMLRNEAKPCLPAKLEILTPTSVRVTLMEGRYHQVRRMLAATGNHVTALHRSRFGHVALEDLAPGKHRKLDLATLI